MKNTFIKIKPKPAPRARTVRSKNSGRVHTYNDETYTQYKQAIQLAYKAIHGTTPTENPIFMKLEFFYQIPKSWSKKKKESAKWHISRPDSDNLVKGIMDALNGIAYRDDSQVCFLQVRKQYAQFDGVKIEIEEME